MCKAMVNMIHTSGLLDDISDDVSDDITNIDATELINEYYNYYEFALDVRMFI